MGGAVEPSCCKAPIATVALVEDPNGNPLQSAFADAAAAVAEATIEPFSRGGPFVGAGGERAGAGVGGGWVLRLGQTVRRQQVVEARDSLRSTVVFSGQNAGDSFSGVVAQIPVLSRFAGALGKVNFKEAQRVISLTDNETAEQVASATGSVWATDLGGGGLLLGRLSGITGGRSTSNEGKVIAAALLDSYAKMVAQTRVLAQKELPAKVPTR